MSVTPAPLGPIKKLAQLNLLEFGNTIQVAGVVYAGPDDVYVCMLPDDRVGGREVCTLELDLEQWVRVIRQTDIMETEVLANASDGKLAKVIIRKSTRQIEKSVAWAVYRRDGYRCRYCGRDDVPLTVDHLVLWEDGGPSTEDNLAASCGKCNKKRGSTPYGEWLKSPYYKKVSRNISQEVDAHNECAVHGLDDIKRRVHARGR